MPAEPLNPFVDLKPQSIVALERDDRFEAAGHLWSANEIDALILARASRRPLLVRGEAGSGKSQIARAAAAVLQCDQLLVEVIHARFEAHELLYRFDAVARLADAHADRIDEDNEKYVKKGQLWKAFEQAEQGESVLLIDEIDKADADIPNALLEVLGNRSFAVPERGAKYVVRSEGDRIPLVVFTTNEERELPAAFVRRCVVLNVSPPQMDKDFVAWLVARGRVHQHLVISDAAREQAAQQVLADRKAAIGAGFPSVGLAEYVDLLSALHSLTQSDDGDEMQAAQIRWLKRLGAYALVKYSGQDQGRKPVQQDREE